MCKNVLPAGESGEEDDDDSEEETDASGKIRT